jgi:flagellar biosynthesis/type III secretory pathway chaperone
MEDIRKTYLHALEALLVLHRELIDVLEREADAMVKHDVPEIEKAVREEAPLVENIRAAEQKRQKTLLRMSQEFGRDLRRATLVDVAEVCGGEYGTRMLRLRSELREVAEEIARKNRLKMLLCEQSLTHVKMMLKFLSGSAETGLYTPCGKLEEKTQQVILDQQA